VVRARGFPIPTFQWQRNGIDIPGATSNRLEVADVSLDLDESIYTVVVRNGGGSASASAQLRVTDRPHLAVTEVMAAAIGGNDWFELTNLDTFPVNLLGYRVSDTYAFDSAFRITNSVTINPGESIIFVERLSPAEFKQWWGEERVWPGLQVITYYGLGLSRSGDLVLIWNAAERDVYEPIARSAFLESPAGSSLEFFAPDFFFPEVSLAGLNGAFPSASGTDVGSPGYMTNPPPRFISMEQTQTGMTARCRVTNGRLYDLRFKTLFSDSSWVTIETYTANDWIIRIPIPIDSMAGQRFFRLEEWQ
jgi:hypothetical protein